MVFLGFFLLWSRGALRKDGCNSWLFKAQLLLNTLKENWKSAHHSHLIIWYKIHWCGVRRQNDKYCLAVQKPIKLIVSYVQYILSVRHMWSVFIFCVSKKGVKKASLWKRFAKLAVSWHFSGCKVVMLVSYVTFHVFFCLFSLRENSIGVEGAKNMAHALHENNTLQDLEWVSSLIVVQYHPSQNCRNTQLFSKCHSPRSCPVIQYCCMMKSTKTVR